MTSSARESLQAHVVSTLCEVFGPALAGNLNDRMKRFLEEAVELSRAAGLSEPEIRAVVNFELSRPVGKDVEQELGGAGLTLFALSAAVGFDLVACIQKETARIDANRERAVEKHHEKPASVRSVAGGEVVLP